MDGLLRMLLRYHIIKRSHLESDTRSIESKFSWGRLGVVSRFELGVIVIHVDCSSSPKASVYVCSDGAGHPDPDANYHPAHAD